ncbi:AMP-dependent synthetase/ligase [Syntrophorhabdus aromaticivorans]|uniref:Long-chain fatty acid--CoA ligase n=1 Tax=Syntrophorhabdus aromaticivorans TaxID=328301 RepID=A0A971M0T6_9BACT|nr:long-chain fatty acid--CoA ligase [Syntrophorhabdus aromaticivorans]NLW34017.1 long-chain fatty acid--CoA ligase [Syntrophorhabdus aromaticivorans]
MTETLAQMFQESVEKFPELPALMVKTEGAYTSITYRGMAQKVRGLGRGFIALGIQKKDHVALLSESRPEWAISDMALVHIGAVNVALFPNIPASQVEYSLSDSGSGTLIVSDRTQLKKAMGIRDRLKYLRIIAMEPPPDGTADVLTFDEVLKLGEASPGTDAEFDERWKAVKPEDRASIIYTSGTTGDPKGVILSHSNFVFNVKAGKHVLCFRPGEILLSFVPLNHVMGRFVDHYLPLSSGSTVAYVESLLKLRQNLQEIQPHYMLLVPRVLDMFREGILAGMTKKSRRTQVIFHWALSAGKECCRLIESRQAIPLVTSFRWFLADRLVFRKIKNRLGLQRLKFFFSGGAPLSRSTAEFFGAIRLRVMEGYGLSETAPLVTVNPSSLLKFGTVGLPLDGIEVKIADDSEILVRGPNVMQGYHNRPEDTAEVIDSQGWFHTGDIGEFDGEGYLRITDRKKNLIVLSNGKKVAPQPLENRLTESPFIAHATVIGDQRNTITALLFPSFKHLRDLAKEKKLDVDSDNNETLVSHPDIERLMKHEIDRLLPDLADFEKIRRFSIVGEELSVENGTLTPTLKVRRRMVLERYKDAVEAMYR